MTQLAGTIYLGPQTNCRAMLCGRCHRRYSGRPTPQVVRTLAEVCGLRSCPGGRKLQLRVRDRLGLLSLGSKGRLVAFEKLGNLCTSQGAQSDK